MFLGRFCKLFFVCDLTDCRSLRSKFLRSTDIKICMIFTTNCSEYGCHYACEMFVKPSANISYLLHSTLKKILCL